MMLFVGVALIFASAVIVMAFRVLLNRPSTPRWMRGGGFASATAVAVTGLMAIGAASILSVALSEWSLGLGVELAATLFGLIVACVLSWKALRRLAPAALELDLPFETAETIAFAPSDRDGPRSPNAPNKSGARQAA